MVAVALAALDFGAIRAPLPRHEHVLDEQRSVLLLLGALPMANVLAVGLLIGHRRRGSRRFLSGFVVLGAIASAVYVEVASLFAEELGIPYMMLSYNLIF
jgi:hypothetical protein